MRWILNRIKPGIQKSSMDKKRGMWSGKMVVIMLAVLAGLVCLLGLSVYSALMLAKKTDELILKGDEEDLTPSLVVRFPDSIQIVNRVAQ